jgi:valyl-tRNA synthetase|tara:strand:+ start:35 stop:286 length:252 start_codon:yes stop_codon:yes gene_type:complete
MKVHKDYRGELDLEVQIERLTKQKKYLQSKCREAGETIKGYKFLVELQKKQLWKLKQISSENEENINLVRGYESIIKRLASKK